MHLNTESETGLIAQEVEQVFPQLVSTDEKGLKQVTYNMELQMHMIQAIKELKTENDALREETKELRAHLTQQNETLAARLSRLEAQSNAVPVSLH